MRRVIAGAEEVERDIGLVADHPAVVAGRVGFFVEVESFDAALERLKSAGVSFDEEPRDEPYGKVVVFRDLYGNRWDLIEPKE